MNLKINHRIGQGIVDVQYFNEFKVNLKFDSVASTFSFDFYFDPRNKQHAELACVSHFHEAIVEHNGETLITGFILSQNFIHAPEKKMVSIGGYSKPGVILDCDIPTNQYPLQSDGLTLRQIANKLISPFRLGLQVADVAKKDAAMGAKTISQKSDRAITKSTASESKNINSYLTDLCSQRNIVLSHTPKGELLLTEANTEQEPILHFDGELIGTEMEMMFNGQGIHSHITVIKQASMDGGNAGEYTVRNPYCPVAYVYRPKVVVADSADDITIEEAAMNELGAELKNITLIIKTDRWEVDGKVIRPNNLITVKDPELFLYNKSTWFIEEVELHGNQSKTTATLKCVPPEVYNGKMPKNIFVDPHENLPRF